VVIFYFALLELNMEWNFGPNVVVILIEKERTDSCSDRRSVLEPVTRMKIEYALGAEFMFAFAEN